MKTSIPALLVVVLVAFAGLGPGAEGVRTDARSNTRPWSAPEQVLRDGPPQNSHSVLGGEEAVELPGKSGTAGECSITPPNRSTPPRNPNWFGESSGRLGYGNGTLWTVLWPEGMVLAYPDFVHSDGSIHMKWPWFRAVAGPVTVDGRRLDAAAPPMPQVILQGPADGYGETGFHPSGLIFPTEGCWEVTAKVADSALTFVTKVVKVPFERLWAHWLPAEVIGRRTDVSGVPNSIREIYGPSDRMGAELIVETTIAASESSASFANRSRDVVTANGRFAACALIGWSEDGRWRSDPDASSLAWSGDGLSYHISQVGLGLGCEDLDRIAGAQP